MMLVLAYLVAHHLQRIPFDSADPLTTQAQGLADLAQVSLRSSIEAEVGDDDRALHDHPWDNTSLLLDGEYIEHTSEGAFHRRPGDFVVRTAAALHRIELINDQPAISLFTTGPKVRGWGFACPQGWVPWRVFTATGDMGGAGQGCGQ